IVQIKKYGRTSSNLTEKNRCDQKHGKKSYSKNHPLSYKLMIQQKKILLVDDDTDLLELLSIRLTAAGFEIIIATSAEAALNCLDIARPHLVISDMQMSGMDGMALFEHIHQTIPTLPVIILTAYGTISYAVSSLKSSIFGYLTKPYDPKTLLDQIDQALRLTCNNGNNETSEISQEAWRKDIVTQHAEMQDILPKVERVAEGSASVLLLGESGVGKELFVRAIHQASKRCCQPFVTI